MKETEAQKKARRDKQELEEMERTNPQKNINPQKNEPVVYPTINLNQREETQPQPNMNINEPIRLNEPKRDLKEIVTNPKNLAEKGLSIMASPKTTAVLGAALAAITGIGLATGTLGAAASSGAAGATASRGGTAVITRTASLGTKSLTTQRAFVGRTATSGVEKIFNIGQRSVAARYATNAKSVGLTTSMLGKIAPSATLLMGAIGSYPFAGFIKEEALQTLGFAANTAINNNDAEGLETAIKEQEELLNPNTLQQILSLVPYANVVNNLNNFFEAAIKKLEVDKRALERMRSNEPNEYQTYRQEGEDIKKRDSAYFKMLELRKAGKDIPDDIMNLAKQSSHYIE